MAAEPSPTSQLEANNSVAITIPSTTGPTSVVSCSNSTATAHVTSEFSTPIGNAEVLPGATTGVTLTQVVTSPPVQSVQVDVPHPQDGAYGGFMVVLPPPHVHAREMTEYQRVHLEKHHQHLILFGLAHAHRKPYKTPPCGNSPRRNNNDDLRPPKVDMSAPPAYESVAPPRAPPLFPLPTYEDVQREKNFEQTLFGNSSPSPVPPHSPPAHNGRPMTFLATVDGENGRRMDGIDTDALLGTDFMFLTGFMVAFLFNWIGFLLIICFCPTVAARYGALSGFGVSLAKWTFIVRSSTEVTSHENDWLWWLIMAFGCLIAIRAFLQYITIKRSWNTLSEQAQERFFFIY